MAILQTEVTMTQPLQAAAYDYLVSYMDEYYATLTPENMEIGRFLCSTMGRASAGKARVRMLDVACGPSAFYWALTESTATDVFCLDVRQDSMDYLGGVVAACRDGKVEERYVEVAAAFSPHGDSEKYTLEVANRFRALDTHNITSVWPYEDASFEVVVSCFGMDHVETENEFLFVLAQARRVLVAGGYLNLVTLCETSQWRSGEAICACLFTTAETLRAHLETAGFKVVELKECVASTAIENDQGYSKMLFCQAVKT